MFNFGYLLPGHTIFKWTKMWGSVFIFPCWKGSEQKCLENTDIYSICTNHLKLVRLEVLTVVSQDRSFQGRNVMQFVDRYQRCRGIFLEGTKNKDICISSMFLQNIGTHVLDITSQKSMIFVSFSRRLWRYFVQVFFFYVLQKRFAVFIWIWVLNCLRCLNVGAQVDVIVPEVQFPDDMWDPTC